MPEGDITSNYTDPLFRFQERYHLDTIQGKFFTGCEYSFAQRTHNQSDKSVQEKGIELFFRYLLVIVLQLHGLSNMKLMLSREWYLKNCKK